MTLNKIKEVVVAMFRQHKWEKNPVHPDFTMTLYDTRCVRCGEIIPIPPDYIDMGWWQGGCMGEKQLLINASEERK